MKEKLEQEGIFLSAQTVRKYMNVFLQLKSVTRKKRRYHYVKGEEPFAIVANLLQQDFHADHANEKWCIDFTYVYYRQCTRYNCSIIDLYNRRIVASVCGSKINADLAILAVEQALKSTKMPSGVILHSDRGSQFTSKAFVEYCKKKGILQSMSRPGCPYDNAVMEHYFNTLKVERLYLYKYQSEEELYYAIDDFVDHYNYVRPHSYNQGKPPAQVE